MAVLGDASLFVDVIVDTKSSPRVTKSVAICHPEVMELCRRRQKLKGQPIGTTQNTWSNPLSSCTTKCMEIGVKNWIVDPLGASRNGQIHSTLVRSIAYAVNAKGQAKYVHKDGSHSQPRE